MDSKPTSDISSARHLSHNLSSQDVPHGSPQTGWLSSLPPSWLPFIQLTRLDRPNGFLYFYLPHLYGSLHAGVRLGSPAVTLFLTNLVILFGTVFMRGATCTWNDILDAPFDRLVPRTRHRPVARGAISPSSAHLFLVIQFLLSLAVLNLLPWLCFVYAVPAMVGWSLYPLAKRATDYPQIFLGFPMAWGVFMGSAAMGADPLLLTGDPSYAGNATGFGFSTWALYCANILWTLSYEIIYSHQDAAYDVKAGVKNIVVLYKGQTKPLLVELAVGQVVLLATAGWLDEAGVYYWIFAVIGAAISLTVIIMRVKLDVPDNCAWWFKVGCWGSTGGTMAVGLLGEYVAAV